MQASSSQRPTSGRRLLPASLALVLAGALGAAGSGSDAPNETSPADAPAPPVVLVVTVDGVIDLGLAPFLARIVDQGAADGVRAILLDINTLGGRVDAAIQIRDVLLDSTVPVIAFIHPRAISAGALISLSCQTIAMAPGGSIGAATPVTGGATDKMEAADEKVVSYWRSEMRATAERHGRSGDVAEAMVDRDVEIEGVIEKGKLLTLTTEQALDLGVADFEASSRQEVLEKLEITGATLVETTINWAERVARVISHPVLSSLLLSLGFLGIIIELYQPGWGIPGTIGAISLLLFFVGHYVVRLAGLEEILLFGIGLLLVAIEMFVIPGFGIVGIAGILSMFIGVVLALLGLDLRLSWDLGLLTQPLAVLSGAALGVSVGAVLAFRFLPGSPVGRVLILGRGLPADEGYTSHDTSLAARYPAGTTGQALGDLRPSGKVKIDGQRLDAVSEGGYIQRDAEVVIVEWHASTAVVRLKEQS